MENALKQLLFGIGILLFAICLYIIAFATDSPPFFFAGLFSQLVGFLVLIMGYSRKN